MFSPCVVIPVYNHERAIGGVADGVLRQGLPCILVDDGSSVPCAAVLDELAAAAPSQLTLLRHPDNRGKGAAVLTAIRHAARSGYSHALQIDADGQHRVADIPRFLEQAAAHPCALIVGCPEYDPSAPPLRLWARYLTHVWVSINTLSRQIKDSMCGFRVYPLVPLAALDQRCHLGERMSFDIEVLVRLYWNGLEVINVPTPVTYPKNGVSHFRAWADTLLISRAHALLFFGMLQRLPMLIARHRSAPMKRLFAPTRGRHWAHINEFSFIAGMRLLFWLCRVFGRWPFRAVLYPVVLWYMLAKPAARAASGDYLLRMAQQDGIGRRKPGGFHVLRHFVSFAENILDKMLLWSGSLPNDPVEYQNLDLIAAQVASKRGALLICCHVGNLELCRVLSKRMAGLKMTVLTHTKHAEKFNRLLARLNPESQLNLLQVTEMSPATAVLFAEKIAQGELIAIAGDRIPVSHNPRVAVANFLGAPAPFPVGPYVMASLLQCPVYLLFTLRHGSAAEIHFELFRESICLPRHERDRALAELAAEYARRLEFFCRRAPFQWYNFYDFWQLPAMEGRDGLP